MYVAASCRPTCNVEVHFESILAGAVASNAGVVSGVGARRGVEDQRADAVLVDDDLMQPVVQHFRAVAEPVHVRVWSSGHDAVEARHLSLGYLDVGRNFAERRPEMSLRDAAQLAVNALISRTANQHSQTTKVARVRGLLRSK